MARLPAMLGAVVIAGVVAAACSSGPGTPSVAGLSGTTTTGPSDGGSTQSQGEQSDQEMVDFTRCMRAHGVQVTDPVHVPGHAGLSLENLPPQNAATHAAYGACNHFIQGLAEAKGAGAAASLSASRLRALTHYARCMRSHDIDMLDPNSQGSLNLGNVPGITSNYGRYSPQFRSADSACRHLLPAGVNDDGSGP
jgi:hypothetical protein